MPAFNDGRRVRDIRTLARLSSMSKSLGIHDALWRNIAMTSYHHSRALLCREYFGEKSVPAPINGNWMEVCAWGIKNMFSLPQSHVDSPIDIVEVGKIMERTKCRKLDASKCTNATSIVSLPPHAFHGIEAINFSECVDLCNIQPLRH